MRTAHIASIPDREASLFQTLLSLTNQVKRIYVALNGYRKIPDYSKNFNNIEFHLMNNSLGDAAKFAFVNKVSGFVFTCDDDLIYKPGYCDYMISKYNEFPGCIISLHGKKFVRPVIRAHRGFEENYHCFNPVLGNHYVDTGGTGVMLFNTKDIKLSIEMFPIKNMADIWVGKAAVEQNVKIVVVEHSGHWLRYITPKNTIWSDHTQEQDVCQVRILNSFLK